MWYATLSGAAVAASSCAGVGLATRAGGGSCAPRVPLFGSINGSQEFVFVDEIVDGTQILPTAVGRLFKSTLQECESEPFT